MAKSYQVTAVTAKRLAYEPLETVYRGYRFRSRLEARWAVFLDTLKIHFDYECESFWVCGSSYLPDFWVGRWGAWIEIKGDPVERTRAALRCEQLARLTERPALLLYGAPNTSGNDITLYPPEGLTTQYQYFGRCVCGGVWLMGESEPQLLDECCGTPRLLRPFDEDGEAIREAYYAATSARFSAGRRRR